MLAEMGLAPIMRQRRRSGTAEAGGSVTESASAQPAGSREANVPGGAQAAQTSGSAREARIAGCDWAALKSAVSGCDACSLSATRTQTVFGVGDEKAQWLLVGEAPGAEEDRLGEPFVGQAGKLLDSMLAAIDLQRGRNVYIANVLKCRPPGNRNPEPEEVACCSPYLLRQVTLISPRLIVAMGRFAAQALLGTDATIASLRGRVHRYAGVPLVVTYHPAYLLRNLPDKSKAWADLLLARGVIAGSG